MRFLRTSRMLHVILALLLLMPGVSEVAAQASPTPTVTYDQAKQVLERFLIEAQRIQGQLDASQYDLDALSAKLGLKANDIVKYVRDNIAFEQYPGLLRGAKWTLIGRAGNSIDQAVLLATLLAKAGYQIKIEHGTLNPEQATNLLLQMSVPRKAPDKIGNLDAIATLIKQMARTAGVSDSDLEPYLNNLGEDPAIAPADLASANADAQSITTALDAAGIKLGGSATLAGLATEASDYFWVSYRKSIDDQWTDAHPAFKDGTDAPVVTATESFDSVAAIPDSDKQTISIEPILERTINGTASTQSLAAPLQGPADQLAGQPLFFTTLSNAAAVVDDPKADPIDILNRANLFAVQFNTHTIDNATVVFDDHGSLFNLKQLKPGEFGITPKPGEVISASLASAIGALGSEPTPTAGPEPKLELTGLWLNITFTAPGGSETTVRRVIVDRIGAANRAKGSTAIANPGDRVNVAAQLAQNVSMFVSVSQTSLAYLTNQFFDRIATVAPLLRGQLRSKYFPNEPLSLTNDERNAIGTAWPGFPPLIAGFDAISKADSAVISYRSAPLFVTYRQELLASGASSAPELQLSVDVVANPRRAYSIADRSVAAAPANNVLAGVWETHSETVPDVDQGKAVTYNTMTVMAAAKSQNIATKVVRAEADLAGIDLTPEALSYLKSDLADGNVLVVPVKTPVGQPLNGWWRIDPTTGVTLGMLANGRGAAMSETGMLIRAIACAAGFAFAGQGFISMLIGCGFAIGGAAAGYAGASALVGEIISVIGLVLGVIANVYGV